jgi:hypothetical protein
MYYYYIKLPPALPKITTCNIHKIRFHKIYHEFFLRTFAVECDPTAVSTKIQILLLADTQLSKLDLSRTQIIIYGVVNALNSSLKCVRPDASLGGRIP